MTQKKEETKINDKSKNSQIKKNTNNITDITTNTKNNKKTNTKTNTKNNTLNNKSNNTLNNTSNNTLNNTSNNTLNNTLHENKPITLKEHQYNTIERVVSRCKNQKGMLIYHELGTGKTFTGLGFLINYPNDKCVVMCPTNLKNTWKSEMDRVNFKKFNKNTEILTHKRLFNYDYKNKVVVIDEAHHIPNLLRKESRTKENVEKLKNFMKNIRTCKKIILLTGTPVFDQLTDLSLLINIAAGKDKITYNYTDFLNRYTKLNNKKSFFYGWLYPIMKSSYIKKPLYFFENTLKYKGKLFFLHFLSTQIWPVLMKIRETHSLKAIDDIKIIIPPKNMFLSFFEQSKKEIFFFCLFFIILKIGKTNDMYGISRMMKYGPNLEPIKNDMAPYIDFYLPDDTFPRYEIIDKEVDYNMFQIEEWFKLIYGIETDETKKLYEFEKNNTGGFLLSSLSSGSFDGYQSYYEIGKIIGNLTFNNVEPSKFTELLEFIKEKKGNQLVYSNFYEKGILLLSKFLKKNKIPHKVLHPDLSKKTTEIILKEFKYGQDKVLLLHPSYSEGISIGGTKYYHLLEPIDEYYKFKQVIGRSLRTNSHDFLPNELRKVTVINWICTSKKELSFIWKTIAESKIYNNFFRGVFWEKMSEAKRGDEFMTPDEYGTYGNYLVDDFLNILQGAIIDHKPCEDTDDKVKCKISTFEEKGNCNE